MTIFNEMTEEQSTVDGCEGRMCALGASMCRFSETHHCGGYVNASGVPTTCVNCPDEQRAKLDAEAYSARPKPIINSSAVAAALGVGEKVVAKLADDFKMQDAVDAALAETQAEMVAGLESHEPTQRENELEDTLAVLRAETQHHKFYREFFETFGGMSLSTHRAIDWHISRDLLAKEQWAEVYQLWSRIDFKVRSDAEADAENPATEIYASF